MHYIEIHTALKQIIVVPWREGEAINDKILIISSL